MKNLSLVSFLLLVLCIRGATDDKTSAPRKHTLAKGIVFSGAHLSYTEFSKLKGEHKDADVTLPWPVHVSLRGGVGHVEDAGVSISVTGTSDNPSVSVKGIENEQNSETLKARMEKRIASGDFSGLSQLLTDLRTLALYDTLDNCAVLLEITRVLWGPVMAFITGIGAAILALCQVSIVGVARLPALGNATRSTNDLVQSIISKHPYSSPVLSMLFFISSLIAGTGVLALAFCIGLAITRATCQLVNTYRVNRSRDPTSSPIRQLIRSMSPAQTRTRSRITSRAQNSTRITETSTTVKAATRRKRVV